MEIYELLSCQELCQLAVLASDWLFNSCADNQEPAYLLTQLLTMTTTQKFPSLVVVVRVLAVGRPAAEEDGEEGVRVHAHGRRRVRPGKGTWKETEK